MQPITVKTLVKYSNLQNLVFAMIFDYDLAYIIYGIYKSQYEYHRSEYGCYGFIF